MMKTIAVINQKGGVGKSTTVIALGAGLILRGARVLFVDLDAQGNLSYALGVSLPVDQSVMDVLTGRLTVREAVLSTNQGDVLASSLTLVGADATINETGKEYRLREALSLIDKDYDFCIVDTPPVLGIVTVNALTAATGIVIPVQADIFSLHGVNQLYGTIEAVTKYCNPALRVYGILLTRFNGRAIISREIAEAIEETAINLNTKLFTSRIRENTAVKESQAVKQNLFAYAPKSNAAVDYSAFIDELIKEV